ncbi:MAG: hypothetical protein K0R38_6764 [Polyangiaceae bacterium]|jgi:hypothetical protein|nr:hypothetical protein [Polyangiaceae bacterium]
MAAQPRNLLSLRAVTRTGEQQLPIAAAVALHLGREGPPALERDRARRGAVYRTPLPRLAAAAEGQTVPLAGSLVRNRERDLISVRALRTRQYPGFEAQKIRDLRARRDDVMR